MRNTTKPLNTALLQTYREYIFSYKTRKILSTLNKECDILLNSVVYYLLTLFPLRRCELGQKTFKIDVDLYMSTAI